MLNNVHPFYTMTDHQGQHFIREKHVNEKRRAKHLTDAEVAAEYFSWMFLASHTAFENGGWSQVAEECSKRAQVLERFATHDQAV
ncbi:hypothetical protein C6401_15300 [Arthrobacter woluwensis]|nr:hypothetical protein C6401_15300 [Arthrobacter woluwensis]